MILSSFKVVCSHGYLLVLLVQLDISLLTETFHKPPRLKSVGVERRLFSEAGIDILVDLICLGRAVWWVAAVLQYTAAEQCQHCHCYTAWSGWSHSTISSLPSSSNPATFSQRTCQLTISSFEMTELLIFRTELTASPPTSTSFNLWPEQGVVIENWTKWRLYLRHGSGGGQTVVYPQTFVRLSEEVIQHQNHAFPIFTFLEEGREGPSSAAPRPAPHRAPACCGPAQVSRPPNIFTELDSL